jgi:hypothetical protein
LGEGEGVSVSVLLDFRLSEALGGGVASIADSRDVWDLRGLRRGDCEEDEVLTAGLGENA